MTSLVKNQIAKQLARFTKNLSPNKISVKFLKGEGELHNLELDEKILSDLLELPPWLRITKAVCNKISAKIHWTKLKTDPICLFLDCVQIDIEEVLVAKSSSTHPSSQQPPPPPSKEKAANRYGFVEKVVDGMYVQINSVLVSFKAPGFTASFQMSRLIIQSTTPEWKPDDLRNTRLKDEVKGEVLTFKEITWSTLRVDAYAQVNGEGKANSAPIRLITSQSSLHITIKKRIEDCSVLSACLKLLLDDILWVLTQSQLQALMGFMNSVNQSMEQSGKKEPTTTGSTATQTSQQHTHTQYSSSNLQNGPDKQTNTTPFAKYDLLETSYHLRTGRIDLHLSDDSNIEDSQGNRSDGVDQLAGGAMQIRINKLATDYYPYHLAGTSRTRWECHNEASLLRAYWVNQLLNTFRNNIRNRKMPQDTGPAKPPRPHVNGTSSVDGQSKAPPSPTHPSQATTSPKPARPPPPASPQRIPQSSGQRRPVFMYETCYLIRCEEFAVMPVTTFNAPEEGSAFLSSDKKALYLPTDMPAFQIDYTQYYYPGGVLSPVPPPNLFVQLNPVQLTLDTTTCIWFNRFMSTILGGGDPVECMKQQQPPQPHHVDIRFEALMPKIILPCPSDPCALYRELRPQALQIQMSQVFFTNSRIGTNTSQTELLMLLQKFSASKLYADYGCFPNDMEDVRPLPNLAWVKDAGVVEDPIKISRLLNGIQTQPHQANCQPSQVWCMSAEQCWADFLGITANRDRPMPFIDAIPIRLWICTPLPSPTPSTMTSRPAPPSPCNRRPQASNPAGNRQRVYTTGKSNWYVPTEETSPENEIKKLGKQSSESLEHHKSREPHSAASSPGCKRAHVTLSPATIAMSNSSPNLKPGIAQTENTKPVDIGSPRGSTSGVELNGLCHSLPASPGSQASEFELTGANTGSVPSVKSDPTDSLSLSSQPCSSSSQEDFILIENSTNAREGSATSIDYPGNLSNVPESEVITNGPFNDTITPSDSSPTTPTQGPFINGMLSEGPQKGTVSSGYLSDQVPNTNECPRGVPRYDCGADEETLSEDPMEPPKVADMSVLAYIPANVVVQLEHFHLMFLFRLQEMMDKLKEEVLHEREKQLIGSGRSEEAPDGTVTFSLLARGAGVNIILPPSPEPTAPVRGDSSLSSYLDPGFVSDGGSGSPEITQDVDNLSTTCTPDGIVLPVKDNDTNINVEIQLPANEQNPESLPVDVISSEGASGRASDRPEVETEDWTAHGGKSLGITRGRRDSDVSCSSSQLGTSVDSSAKSSAQGLRAGRIVSIFNAEGTDIHMGIHMEGDDLTLKLIAHELKIDEKGNLNIEKYLNQKAFKSQSRDNKSIPVPIPPTTPPVLSVRAEIGPGAERNAQTAGERGFAHVQARDINAAMLMSNMESMADCFDDEILMPKMPIYVELKNSSVNIRDDKPPRLLSALPPLPINVNIENLAVFRNHEGMVNIRAINTSSVDIRGSAGACSTTICGLGRDSPKLVSRQLSRSASESSIAESMSSKSDNYDSERESIKAQLSVSRVALNAVQEERQALLKTIERLQMELTLSNRESDRLQARLMVLETGATRAPGQRRMSHR